MGDTSHALRFEDGTLVDVSRCAADAPCDGFIGGTDDHWHELLAPVPRPYYQDVVGAAVMHGMVVPFGDPGFAAYYPAVRRLVARWLE